LHVDGVPRFRTVVVVAVVFALGLAGLTAVFSFTSLSPTTRSSSSASTTSSITTSTSSTTISSQTPSGSTSAGTSSGGFNITSINDDVTLQDEAQLKETLINNFTVISSKYPFIGTPGEMFEVDIQLTFQACPCVHQVVEVDSLTPGFTVVGTTPSLPLLFGGLGGDTYTNFFSVEVMAPATQYNGTLTLVIHIQ